MSSCLPQFRLRTLLLAFLPIAAACFFVRDYVHNRPLHWDRYDPQSLQSQLSAGRVVVVYREGSATCGRGRFVPTPCRDGQVVRYARQHHVAAMYAWPGHSLPGVPDAWEGRLLVYSPSQPNVPRDVVWFDAGARTRLLAALRTAQPGDRMGR